MNNNNLQQVKAELISALEMWEVTNKYLNRIAGNLDNENSNLTPINIQQGTMPFIVSLIPSIQLVCSLF